MLAETFCGLCLSAGLTALMLETNWMRVRLLAGAEVLEYPSSPWYPGRWIDAFGMQYGTRVKWLDTIPEGYYFELDAFGIRSKLTLVNPETVSKVMKACKPSKRLKLQYKEV